MTVNSRAFHLALLTLETSKGSRLHQATPRCFAAVQGGWPCRVECAGSPKAVRVRLPTGLWTPFLLETHLEPSKVPLSQNLSSKEFAQRTILLIQTKDLPDICTEGQCGGHFESRHTQSHPGSPKISCLSCELFTNSSVAHWHDLNSECYF